MLVALDLETTGVNTETARIVEIALVLVGADAPAWVRRINPGVPIPAESTAVHGITDADVLAAPALADIADEIAGLLRGAEIVGHNVRAYDLPVLRTEFARLGRPDPCEGAVVYDTLAADRALRPHTLDGALRHWCGRPVSNAHSAAADAQAAADVLGAMRTAHPETDFAAFGERPADWATACGRIRWDAEGHAVFAFGKERGRRITAARGFASWVIGQTFPADVKDLCRKALREREVRRT